MRKQFIAVRIAPEKRKQLEELVSSRGETLTTFVVRAIDSEITRTLKEGVRRTPEGEVAAFFRAMTQDAEKGGAIGYGEVGRQLVLNFHRVFPGAYRHGAVDRRQLRRVERFSATLKSGSDDDVMAWFEKNLPAYLGLIPKRRQGLFLAGVREEWFRDSR